MSTATETPVTDGLPVHVYVRLLRTQHVFIAEGKGDSEEAEARADCMDAPWHAMTGQERDRVAVAFPAISTRWRRGE